MSGPNRRTILKGACLTSVGLTLPNEIFGKLAVYSKDPIKLGVIADLHGGFAVDAEKRLETFIDAMSEESLDAILQLGDFAFPNAKNQHFADRINSAHKNVIHVIGNHEFDYGLKRADCFQAWGIESAYYGRNVNGLRVLVLDGNERGSPDYKGGYPSYIGKKQQEWLATELSDSTLPVLVVSHQPLAGHAAVDNAAAIQLLLSRFKDKIVLCLNGHSHIDSLVQVNGVTYVHINSASYYWVGGKKRMAYYEDALYSTLTIDPRESKVTIEGTVSRWKEGDDPRTTAYFDPDSAPPETIVLPAIRNRQLDANRDVKTSSVHRADEKTDEELSLKVMTWNIWGRLNQDPRYTVNGKTARERTIEIIRASGADVIAMIETYGSAKEIADSLGFHFHTPKSDANLCLFSRYPLSDVQLLEGLSSFSFIAATAMLPGGQKIRFYDVWLTSGGRHIVKIKDKKVSDQEFCEGDNNRYEMLKAFLAHADVRQYLDNSNSIPVIVAGDFNCVSHLDHHVGTRESGLNHGRVLPTKVSKAMHKAGFTDTYRAANPDIVESTLGHTWTTVGMGFEYKSNEGFVPVDKNSEPEYRDPYARIDYIYSLGEKLKPINSTVLQHYRDERRRSFPEFPSDHAAVLTEFRVAK